MNPSPGSWRLLFPAGDCERCDEQMTVVPRATTRGVVQRRWKCPTHGTCVLVVNEDRSERIGIRAGEWPSPSTTAFLAELASVSTLTPGLQVPSGAQVQALTGGRFEVDEVTAAVFAVHGLEPAQVDFFLSHAVVAPSRMQQWAAARLPLDEGGAGQWLRVGLTDPTHVRHFITAGVPPRLAAEFKYPIRHTFTVLAGVPAEPAWGMLDEVVSPEFAGEGHRQGRSVAAVARLGHALSRTHPEPETVARPLYSAWSAVKGTRLLRYAESADLFDWFDVADCLDAGMGFEEAASFIEVGGDMEPVRLLAALTRPAGN